MKHFCILFFLAIFSLNTQAQEYPVSTGSIVDCGGFLVDNGFSASDYGPNENSTTTICPDGTDDPIVNLYFASFNLGEGDQLSIYDGVDTNAPLIGTFTGIQIQSQDITSTNLAGCLTVNFTSNGDASVGSFGAEISCGLPCARPLPVVTTNQQDSNPVRLCVGEELVFDASTSQFAEGTSLATLEWDFNDGTTDNASWPTVAHSFTEPGAYVVQLHLTDDDECTSAVLPDVLIYVATFPEMTAVADDYLVCLGQEVNLTGLAIPVNWSALPDANFGGALYIPDDQSQCFSDELIFGGFAPGASIETVDDLEYLFINFEHTFMGDLTISFICPNGQTLLVHNQGGGGTHLGFSNEMDDPNLPGEGWDYYWAPDATNGTWSAEAAAGTTIDNGGGIQSLVAGTYSSDQPFSNLIGCPLNGAWAVEVCDLWGADDGFIFDWSVQFAADLYPDIISFTPSIGAGCDSTFWSGQFIIDNGGNCDDVTLLPTQEGTFLYTYTALDNHGCSYTEEISISAFPGPVPTAGPDGPFCGDPVQLSGSVTNPVNGITYIYTWTPSANLSGANTQNPTASNLSETTTFVFSVQPSNDPQCLVSDDVTLFIPATPPSLPIDSLEWCAGGDYLIELPFEGTDYDYTWYFSPSDDIQGEQIQTSDLGHQATNTGHYTLTYVEPVCGFAGASTYYVELLLCNITIPNVFSPNGDGTNDQLVILGLENFPKSTIKVYSRWGGLVYEDDNYTNNWSPRDLAEGTYFFVLGVNKRDGAFDYYESHLTLVRD